MEVSDGLGAGGITEAVSIHAKSAGEKDHAFGSKPSGGFTMKNPYRLVKDFLGTRN
jgi:hypothetical protein